MPDRDDLGSAWKVPPSRYLAGRPAEHQVGTPRSLYVAMADGCRLIDVDGNEYLDFFAGVAVASLGHAHPRFVAAMTSQIQRLSVGSFTSEPSCRSAGASWPRRSARGRSRRRR